MKVEKIGTRNFSFKCEVIICNNHTAKIKMNIPKSGCIIRRVEIKIIKKIFKNIE
jgi:hypothetical protein